MQPPSRFPSWNGSGTRSGVLLRSSLSRRCFSLGLACVALTRGARSAAPRALFVIARSLNANQVHYAVRYSSHAGFDRERPLQAYWVMHAEDGRREELSWLERQFAYGWSIVSPITAQHFELQLLAFPRRVLVRLDGSGGVRAEVIIQGRAASLQRIFVQLGQGPGLVVRHVDVFGIDLASGRALRERILAE
jgi:hypothetical protein